MRRNALRKKSLFTPRLLRFVQLEDRVLPATFLVLNTLDDGGVDPPPVPVLDGSDNGTGTLRQAIVNANANPGPDLILFDSAAFGSGATIVLQNVLPQLTGETTIVGLVDSSNQNLVTISGAGLYQVLDTRAAAAGTTIQFKNLIISKGNAGTAAIGGGITVGDENVTIQNCSIVQNTADQGGGIRVTGAGTLTIIDSTLANNSSTYTNATPTANGGGALRLTTNTKLVMTGSTVKGNTASNDGGGLYASGSQIEIKSSVFISNRTLGFNTTTALLGGGAIKIVGSSQLTIDDSTITQNTSASSGGGIYNNNSKTTITNSLISNNTAQANGGFTGRGGGVFNNSGYTFSISNSRVTGNSAAVLAGGLYGGSNAAAVLSVLSSTIDGNTAGNAGGAIHTFAPATLKVESSTVHGNRSNNNGGGISVNGALQNLYVSNSTFVNNTSAIGGGAIHLNTAAASASIIIQNSTITGNVSNGTTTTAGVAAGGVAVNVPVTVLLDSNIISGNTMPAGGNYHDLSLNVAATLLANHNAFGSKNGHTPVDTTSSPTPGTNLDYGLNLLMDGLADHGGELQGPTGNTIVGKTIALLPGSPALNKGSNPSLLANDQRGKGFPREFPPGSTDIGAYERLPGPPAASGGPYVNIDESNFATLNPYVFTVSYLGDTNIDVSKLGNTDVRVTNPATGYDQLATFVSASPASDNPSIVATYKINAPTGGWTVVHNGEYSITVQENEVFLASSTLSVPTTKVGSFFVTRDYLVTNPNNDGPGSLREAIVAANAAAGTNTIRFDDSFKSVNTILIASELNVTDSVQIIGPGAKLLTVDAQGTGRVFNITNTSKRLEVSISGMTITGGTTTAQGGGIFFGDEILTLTEVHLTNNKAANGGALGNNNSLVDPPRVILQRSALTGNSATNRGAGIMFYSSPGSILDIRNSTISGNSANGIGGGLYGFNWNSVNHTLKVTNSTVTNNSSGTGAGGLRVSATTAPILEIRSSIVAGNTGAAASPNIQNGTVNSEHSALGDFDGYTQGTSLNDILPGTPLLLEPLADNGGPTPTHAFNPASPLKDAGINPHGETTDQRGTGYPRVVGPSADIGAFEFNPVATPTVTSISVNDGAAQRSRLTRVVVTFSGPVNPASFSGAGNITLTRTAATPSGTVGTIVQTGATGANGLITVTQPGPTNQLVLTFSNANSASETAGVEYGSLADGRWQLAIPSASYTSTLNDPVLRRLFGDFEPGPPALSNGTVDSGDFGALGLVFGTTPGIGVSPFDYDNNGVIDSIDFAAFGGRFGISI